MKILALTTLYFLVTVFCAVPPVYAQTLSYALIKEECILYVDEQTLSPMFSLPPSYFVKILQEDENVWKVSYLDCVGYVKADSVDKIDYTPLNKYPQNTTTLVNNDGNTVTMRSSPSHLKDNIIAKLDNDSYVTFYGIREGSEQIEMLGNEWCYIKDKDGNYGYVYNLYVKIPTFSQNDYSAKEPTLTTTVTSSLSLSSSSGTIVIIVLCASVTLLLIIALKTVRKRTE
ncbi:MAG: SH3 domain-containing protein [Clostridiales bacterium]|nr:SH3 domain-containing protein [Clostridiales bacterium]